MGVLCSFCVFTLVSLTKADPIAFVWPEKYVAQVAEVVIDSATSSEGIIGQGYIYTDYSIPAQRTDELWNMSSLSGSEFGSLGLSGDQHLIFENIQYFSYYNSSGFFCSLTPFGIFDRYMFNEDTFVGASQFDGVPSWYWSANLTLFGMNIVYDLFADQSTMYPLYTQMTGPPDSVLEFNSATYTIFEIVDHFPSDLFAIPNGCRTSPITNP